MNADRAVLLALVCLSVVLLYAVVLTNTNVRPVIRYVYYDPGRVEEEPVDAVYTWVNPEDEAWRAEYKKHNPQKDMSEKRFNNKDAPDAELQTSLELLFINCPWIQTVYVATMRPQVPPCFANAALAPHVQSGRLRVVHHDEFFPDTSVLPVFNSHAIEANLHRIPGLQSRWMYFNDDMMTGRPVDKNMLFYHGKPVTRGLWMPVYIPFPIDAHVSGCVNSGKRLGNLWYLHNDHTPAAVHSNVVADTALAFQDVWSDTARARLRDHNQIVPLGFVENVALDKGEYVFYKNNPLKTFAMLSNFVPSKLVESSLPRYHFFCINNIPPSKLVDTVNRVRASLNLAPLDSK